MNQIQYDRETKALSLHEEVEILHALDVLEEQGPLETELVFLQCTSPFTTGAQIDAVLAALHGKGSNSSFSVTLAAAV